MEKRIKKSDHKPINLVVVHENEVFRLGLKALFNKTPGIRVIGEASCLAGAVNCIKQRRPTVILMDIRLTNGRGAGGVQEILTMSPDTQLVLLVNADDEKLVLTAIRSGAKGILLKGIPATALLKAIRTIAGGHAVLDSRVTHRVFTWIKNLPVPRDIDGVTSLTSQERQVLALLARCKTNKEIAAGLGLSVKTIQNYLANVFEKLNITRRCQAAVLFANRPIPDLLEEEKE